MINKIKKIFLPKQEPRIKTFTNNDLLAELVACFKQNIEAESVGNRMLFPTSFNVLLKDEDYNSREQSLPFVVQEIVNTFYVIIKDKSKEYPNYLPPAKSWNFQFSPCNELQIDEVNKIQINSGSPYIMARLFSTNLSNSNSTSNTRVSFKPKNSDVYSTYNINPEVFRNLDVIGSGIFSLNFDSSLNPLTSEPNHQGTNTYAELNYNQGASLIHFSMIDKQIQISGKNETRNETRIMKIDSDNIINNHVVIKYDNVANNFQIATYGSLRVNERNIEVSIGGDVKWHPLTKKSNLLIGDVVPVEFIAKK